MVVFFFETIYVNLLYEIRNDITEIGYFRILWPQIMAGSYSLTTNGLVNAGVIILMVSIINYYSLRINMWLLTKIVSIKHSSGRKLALKLLWYRRVYIKTLISMLKFNEYLSQIFLVFLIVNMPINCYLNFLLMSSNNIMVIIILIFVITEQVIVILCIHLALASLNSQFDKNILHLTMQFIQHNSFIKFQLNLKMSLFIQAFLTRKKYGLSYSKIGIISMMAFTKVILSIQLFISTNAFPFH